ncbi:YcxB family protein [Candidatus Allofournierella excrementigallinarum]|uniref:YcxB family protein n=1 Tax=Candidatus Allofournierella excrementigallinarum TaxID=2838592 RepID=UPI00374F4654
MDWNFELTEQAALALYAKKYRQEKASGRLLRALGVITGALGVWTAVQAAQKMMRPGYFYDEFDPVGGALYVVLAAVLLALTFWAFLRSRPRAIAAGVLRRQKKLGASPLGQWRVHLDEEKLLTVRAGLQEASDPSVVQKVEQYPEGLLVYLYGGAKMLALPAPAFEGPEGMKAAAAQFERCAALAKARLYEESARQTAGEQEGRILPPCPPLPEGETQMYAAPQMLRPEEVLPAYCAANRLLNPIGKGRLALLWVLLVASVLEAAAAVATGDAALAVAMAAMAAVLALALAARSPAAQRGAIKRQVEGEQAQRLSTPGWVVLGRSGFTSTSGALCSYRPYASLNKVAQDENYIFLRFEGNMITAIPKRGFENPEQARQAFEFLRQKQAGQKSGRSGQ